MRRRHKALRIAQPLPGGGEGEAEGGGSAPVPSWTNLTGDAPVPVELRTHIPCLERILLVSQLFTWNIACPGSLIVCVIFWAALVRRKNPAVSVCPAYLSVCVSHADRFLLWGSAPVSLRIVLDVGADCGRPENCTSPSKAPASLANSLASPTIFSGRSSAVCISPNVPIEGERMREVGRVGSARDTGT